MIHSHGRLAPAASWAEIPKRKERWWLYHLHLNSRSSTKFLLDKDHRQTGWFSFARCLAGDLREIRDSGGAMENPRCNPGHQRRRSYECSKNDWRHHLPEKLEAKLFIKNQQLIPIHSKKHSDALAHWQIFPIHSEMCFCLRTSSCSAIMNQVTSIEENRCQPSETNPQSRRDRFSHQQGESQWHWNRDCWIYPLYRRV